MRAHLMSMWCLSDQLFDVQRTRLIASSAPSAFFYSQEVAQICPKNLLPTAIEFWLWHINRNQQKNPVNWSVELWPLSIIPEEHAKKADTVSSRLPGRWCPQMSKNCGIANFRFTTTSIIMIFQVKSWIIEFF